MSNFDDWKDKLEDHESPVSARVWIGVENELRNKQKKRGGFIWFVGILSILIGTFILYSSKDSVVKSEEKILTADYKTFEEATPKLTEKIKKLEDVEEATNTNKNIADQYKDLKNNKSLPVSRVSKKKIISKKVFVEGSDLASTMLDEIVTVQANETKRLKETENLLQESIRTESGTSSQMNPSQVVLKIEPLSQREIFISFNQFPTIERCDLPDPPIGCPDLNRKSGGRGLGLSKWVVDLTYGPGFAFRSLTAKGPESEDYVNLRNTNETAVYDQMIQARISYVSKWGLAARTGINYGHLVEKLTYARDSILRSTTTITIDTLFNPDGSFTITSDTINIPSLGQLDKGNFNHFKTFQVPIILGFEKRIKDWTFHVNGGLLMNFYLQRKGEILNPADQPVDISTDTGNFDAFNNDWGMLLYGSIGANYRIGDRLHAVVEPSFRYTLKPITTNTYSLDQKYMIVNINLGLRYEF